jgi:hypothetical protein
MLGCENVFFAAIDRSVPVVKGIVIAAALTNWRLESVFIDFSRMDLITDSSFSFSSKIIIFNL